MLDDASRAFLAAIERGDHDEADRLERVLDAATLLEQAQRDAPGRIAEAAHGYADRGVAVFPIEPRGKRPLTQHGFKDATVDHDQIAAWWAQWPDANLGLPTGLLFDVIDVDTTEGIAIMFGGATPLIHTVTPLGHVSTARDGGHHIYVPPAPGRGNKTAVYPGIDYRGEGGYVVAPPSVGANGRRYTWVTDLTLNQAAAA